MARVGIETARRDAVVQAAIREIAAAGSLDVTVGRIARSAGMSPALAHHYFGNKEQIFLAAMRHVLTVYRGEVRRALAGADGPRARLEALVEASFAPSNFARETVAAWLNFYLLALTAPEAARLLRVYQGRLRSNLVHDLRPLLGPGAEAAAERLAGLIDGLYLRHALSRRPTDGAAAAAARAALAMELGAGEGPR